MRKFLLTTLISIAAFASPAYADKLEITADKIGGIDVLCAKQADKDKILAGVDPQSIAHYTPEETKAFNEKNNAVEPVTTFTGENMVSIMIAADVYLAFDEPGDRWCRFVQPVPAKVFDEMRRTWLGNPA